MRTGWLVKLTTNMLGTNEWYISAADNGEMAVAAVRALPGNFEHAIEAVRPMTTKEMKAVKVDPQQFSQQGG